MAFTYLAADEDARETEGLVKEAGRRVLAIKTDQGRGRQVCEDAVDDCLQQMGRLDVLVNNAAFQPSDDLAPYAATKGAIANFTVSLAKEAIGKGVRVNSVAPGPVWTPLIPSTLPEEKVRNFGANTLFGRPAQPAELAPLYVFLASAEASYVTGEIYGVTGGRLQI